ncbi:DNA polymerase Y family protein [Salininema proteolyticum]|uniref:DNA polymerase Y family protein n=1 Tax=Salininema proteolyticum TaxID=1607685 RepID=A0ABV8U0H2_9ACTN
MRHPASRGDALFDPPEERALLAPEALSASVERASADAAKPSGKRDLSGGAGAGRPSAEDGDASSEGAAERGAVGGRRGAASASVRRTAVLRLPDWTPDTPESAFEPVVEAVSRHAPYIEVLHPGVLALSMDRRASERPYAEALIDDVTAATGWDALLGIADGLYAALLAARFGMLVPPGGDAAFLARADVSALGLTGLVDPGTCDVLRHLGVRTLGEFTALPADAVLERFGPSVRAAQRLAAAEADRPLRPEEPERDLSVGRECDPPLESLDQAVALTRSMAEELASVLDAHNVSCHRITVRARTVVGTVRERTWRIDEPTVPEIVRRLRWQIEGWLVDGARSGGAEGPNRLEGLELVPVDTVGLVDDQVPLWEVRASGARKGENALAHTQSLLGPEAVTVCAPVRVRDALAPEPEAQWDQDLPEAAEGPWPGAMEGLVPGVPDGHAVELLDAGGTPVGVGARGLLDADPAFVAVEGRRLRVRSWAGPWPVAERWWSAPRRYARLQVVLEERPALLVHESGRWTLGGWYD